MDDIWMMYGKIVFSYKYKIFKPFKYCWKFCVSQHRAHIKDITL